MKIKHSEKFDSKTKRNIQEEDVSEVYIRVFRHKATTLLADPKAADLLLHMLDVDPQRRPTAHMLLSHPYFFQNV